MTLLFISASCSLEESIPKDTAAIKYQPIATNEAANFFSGSTPKSISSKTANNLNLIIDNKSLSFQSIENTDVQIPVFKATTKNANIISEVFLVKVKDTILPFLLNRMPDEQGLSEQFSGIISITELNGHFVNGYRIVNGFFVSQFVRNRLASKNNRTSRMMTEPEIGCDESLDPFSIFCSQQLSSVSITSPKTSTFSFGPRGIDASGWNISAQYSGGSTGDGGGYGGTDGLGNQNVFPCDDPIHGCDHEYVDDVAAAIEDRINDTELDDCTKGILAKLKNLTQNDIVSIFEKFGTPKDSAYNITIKLGIPYRSDALAETVPISKNNYLITISEEYIKGASHNLIKPTDLSIAAVIIHELIHAHFLALFDDFHNNGDFCAYDSFVCLYEKYVTKNYEGTIDAQHAQMFDNYIPKIAAILQEFKPGSSSQFYEDLAMSTMYGLQYFDDKYPKGSEGRTRIENNRIAEDSNTPRGEATPKGVPCK